MSQPKKVGPVTTPESTQRVQIALQKDTQTRGSMRGGNRKNDYPTKSSILYLPPPAEMLKFILHSLPQLSSSMK